MLVNSANELSFFANSGERVMMSGGQVPIRMEVTNKIVVLTSEFSRVLTALCNIHQYDLTCLSLRERK
jgi:hypothetical protein